MMVWFVLSSPFLYLTVVSFSASSITSFTVPSQKTSTKNHLSFSTNHSTKTHSAKNHRSEKKRGRIVKGHRAGHWPFVAAIGRYEGEEIDQFCGGSILNDDTILTATHCIYGEEKQQIKAEDTIVIIGARHLRKAKKRHIFQAKKFYYNKAFANTLLQEGAEDFEYDKGGDIAIIKLKRKINFKKFFARAEPVCLPGPADKPNRKDCWVIGWGGTETADGSDILLQTRVPIQSAKKCKKAFGWYNDKQLICAGLANGKKGGDACQGDSGGPLLCSITTDPKMYLQFGIVSYGEECGVGGQYQRTAPWIKWIRKHAEKK